MTFEANCPYCLKKIHLSAEIPPAQTCEPVQGPEYVEELELDVRPYNALKNANINKVAELIQLSSPELLRQKNFGKVSLANVQYALGKFALALKGERPETPQNAAAAQ